jgi:hypothetical protein
MSNGSITGSTPLILETAAPAAERRPPARDDNTGLAPHFANAVAIAIPKVPLAPQIQATRSERSMFIARAPLRQSMAAL